MKKTKLYVIAAAITCLLTPSLGLTSDTHSTIDNGSACVGFGPQTPRDIDNPFGNNPQVFKKAKKAKKMNLCNIHFHKNAEHKAADFSIVAGDGDSHGVGGGYQCNMSQHLSAAELAPAGHVCEDSSGHGLQPGDTIEVHWVHTSCQTQPGKGLGSCLSNKCANPELRVETQVFTLVNDSSALNFNDYDLNPVAPDGVHHQAKSLPSGTGTPVTFLGSTTGPSFSEQVCSPLQVTWSVRPQCAKLDINSVAQWCQDGNAFLEDHAHGVRKLVVNPDLLSTIQSPDDDEND